MLLDLVRGVAEGLKDHLKRTACLSLIKALPDMIANRGTSIKHGRLKNLLARLSKESGTLLSHCPRLNKQDESMLVGKITEWADQTGWDLKQNEMATVVAFLIGVVVDNMPNNDKILSILEDIYGYFDRAKAVRESYDVEGTRAAGIWSDIFVDG